MTHSVALEPTVRIDAETAADAAAIDAVVLAAFGPGRFAKTAERLREQTTAVAGFVAREENRVIGSVRLWPIRVGDTEALFLGPIAVEAGSRRAGLGADLVAACVDHARATGASGVLLVGDSPYFSRFGFGPSPDVDLPGPVDRRRLLWLPLGTALVGGPVRPIR
jgi:predicted N-acetyltransferase YhbS